VTRPRAGQPPRGRGEEPDRRETEERGGQPLDRNSERQKTDQRRDGVDVNRVLVLAERLEEERDVNPMAHQRRNGRWSRRL